MGNTPSSQSGGPGSRQRSTSTSVIAPGAAAGRGNSSSAAAGSSSTAPTFHSGLTPPERTPSPECPPTPPLLPYGGHLSPQNPHALILPQAHDYSKTVVTQLILEARIAPFYRGLEDYEEDFTEEDIGRLLNELREKDFEEDVQNTVTAALKAERKGQRIRTPMDDEKLDRERKAYMPAVECPICFLVSTR